MHMTEKQQKMIEQIARHYGLKLVIFFGSHARGTTHSKSDIDIGFLAERDFGLREIAEIEFEMAQKLNMPRLELTRLGGTSSLFLQQVVSEGQLLYEDAEGAYASFAVSVFKRFIDEKPLRDLKNKSLRAFSAAL